MGHLRGLLRACAWDVARGSAATVLERVDDLLAGLGIPTMATMVYARLDPHPGGGWALTHSNAGHPRCWCAAPTAPSRSLSAPPQAMLGVAPTSRHASMHRLRPGDTLLACTDGLVERRDRDLTEGLDEPAAGPGPRTRSAARPRPAPARHARQPGRRHRPAAAARRRVAAAGQPDAGGEAQRVSTRAIFQYATATAQTTTNRPTTP
nr:PP2C family protein-serine/threonine phosphatase [Angustibacter aerolatus]